MTTPTPELGFETASQLSFITEPKPRCGNGHGVKYFDVPDERFAAGVVTGTHVALELLDAVKRSTNAPGATWVVGQVVRAAIAAEASGRTPQGYVTTKPSRRGAAYGFMLMMDQAVVFLAKHGTYRDFLTRQAENYEQVVDAEKAEIKERTARAIAARKAKRIAKNGGAE